MAVIVHRRCLLLIVYLQWINIFTVNMLYLQWTCYIYSEYVIFTVNMLYLQWICYIYSEYVIFTVNMLYLQWICYIYSEYVTFTVNMLYTVSGKKRTNSIWGITSSNTGRFSKFFQCHNLLEICNKAVIKFLTTPQTRRYTTLWKTDVGKLVNQWDASHHFVAQN